MTERPSFGRARGEWQRFTQLRQPCPGCEQAGNPKAHGLCRVKQYERGDLVECWRMKGQAVAGPCWFDLGDTGGLGCRSFFISNSASTGTSQSKRTAASRTIKTTPTKVPQEVVRAWCERLHQSAATNHRAHSSAVAEFYAERKVPFDHTLYSVGPSRIEAKRLVDEVLPRFQSELGLDTFNGLPGVLNSQFGDNAFFPAAKCGEAWEWTLSPDGSRCNWSRRFINPEKEGANNPKSKSPIGASHHLHHCVGWRELIGKNGALLLTEGTRKANEVQRRTGVASLGLPSVAISRRPKEELISLLSEVCPTTLYLAPDWADLADGKVSHDATRHQVLGWKSAVTLAENQGARVRALAWDCRLGKGLDDVLATLRWEWGRFPE